MKNRQEYNSALETEIKKFLGLDNEIPIDYQCVSEKLVNITSLGKTIARISASDFSEIKSRVNNT